MIEFTFNWLFLSKFVVEIQIITTISINNFKTIYVVLKIIQKSIKNESKSMENVDIHWKRQNPSKKLKDFEFFNWVINILIKNGLKHIKFYSKLNNLIKKMHQNPVDLIENGSESIKNWNCPLMVFRFWFYYLNHQ